ncbi:MAG: DUF434 domain-containing protein [Spirochaetes bacterium]|nr:DUF434 domain-containing protein [Spirochaetota bacterium]
MNKIRIDLLKKAIKDYSTFLNKNYPADNVFKIVSDFYKLNNVERGFIKRGVCKKEILIKRKKKRLKYLWKLRNKNIYIDFFNILLTFHSFYTGKVVFIGLDGYLRDISLIGGHNIHKINVEKYYYCIFEFFIKAKPKKVIVLFDEPVSFSKNIKEDFENYIKNIKNNFINNINYISKNSAYKRFTKINFELVTIKNPDNYLIELKDKNGVLVTSDSYIIDKSELKIFDLVGWYIKKVLKKKVFNL